YHAHRQPPAPRASPTRRSSDPPKTGTGRRPALEWLAVAAPYVFLLGLLTVLGTAVHAAVAGPITSRADYDGVDGRAQDGQQAERSEEHTSELQSRSDLVCRLLL